MKKTIILGIETSCDETAAAVLEVTNKEKKFEILSNVVLSQINIHRKTGGIVPEVAARNHIKDIISVLDKALSEAKVKPQDIDKIAVTKGPGLITSLMVGVETAKILSMIWNKPLAGINHLKGHIYTAWIGGENPKSEIRNPKFPLIALVVSGGHTELVLMKSERSMEKIGQTLDDAAGEAFDKVAKILGLKYPGGPEISKLAEKVSQQCVHFPRPLINSKDFNFSFSGLKTAVLYTVNPPKTKHSQKKKGVKMSEQLRADICADFQQAVIDVLVAKTKKATLRFNAKTVVLTGGVAANRELRRQMSKAMEDLDVHFIVPEFKLCTDNGVMAAVAGYFEKSVDIKKIKVDPNLEI